MGNTNEGKNEGIVLNRMYSGFYLDDNIGHEIINLFKADDNVNYIYLCKDGRYTKESLPEYTVQVRTHSTRTLEIISIAEIEEKVSLKEIDKIKYGGVSIHDIFKGNQKQGADTYVTFKAKRVIKPDPKFPVYIAYEGNRKRKNGYNNNLVSDEAFILNEKKDGKYKFDVNEALRNYIDKNVDPNSDYSKLSEIISKAFMDYENPKGSWQAVGEKVDACFVGNDEIEVTPAEIYGIGNWELSYSNAFSFFLRKYPELLLGFCKHQNNRGLSSYLTANPNVKLIVKREWKNIDILIEVGLKWVIVIENKIFSDLNGKIGKEFTQLDKYHDIVSREYAQREKIFVLLIPNHNNIDTQKYPDWKKIFYGSVAGFLETTQEYVVDENLKTFTTMVKRHSDVDYNLGEMKRRFERVLREKKKSKMLFY